MGGVSEEAPKPKGSQHSNAPPPQPPHAFDMGSVLVVWGRRSGLDDGPGHEHPVEDRLHTHKHTRAHRHTHTLSRQRLTEGCMSPHSPALQARSAAPTDATQRAGLCVWAWLRRSTHALHNTQQHAQLAFLARVHART